MRVVLATKNAAKLAEVAAIIGGAADVVGLEALVGIGLPPEDGATYEENALVKARAVAGFAGAPALGDDSGLEVDALGGAPGVRSSRYAGAAGDAEANNDKLLRELESVPERNRGARFVCAAALVSPDGQEWLARGEVEGRIALVPRGNGGFGYDPLFIPEGYGRTFAEMTPSEKNAISHRTKAFRAIKKYFDEL